MRATFEKYPWLWMALLLLVLSVSAGRSLNAWPILIDEAATMMSAGARNFGPLSLAESLEVQHSRWPDQAFGWVLLVNLWGNVVGWTTVALRALSWFAGLLTLALLYRCAGALFRQQVGIRAALLLASSVFFVTYLHIARVFTTVALLSTLTLWSYWRVALHAKPPGRGAMASLLLGGAGLLYAHYFAALLLPALGLFHLLFLRMNRRWWRVTLLFALVALCALPELAVLRGGIEWNLQRFGGGSQGLSMTEIPLRLLHTLTNGLLSLPRQTGPLLLLLLAVTFLLLLRQRARNASPLSAAWYLAVTALFFLALVLGLNEFVPVLQSSRVRYLMVLWPLLATLAACGLWLLGLRRQRLADWTLAALVASGIALSQPNSFYQSVDAFWRSDIHLADQALLRHARAEDFLLLDEAVLPASGRIREYYATVLDYPRAFITQEEALEPSLQRARAHDRVWLLASQPGSRVERELAGRMTLCRRPLSGDDMVLSLYARAAEDCA